jgi:hypothetical protein
MFDNCKGFDYRHLYSLKELLMHRLQVTVVALVLGVVTSWTQVEARIARVPQRLNMIEFFAGGSSITGNYTGLGADSWQELFVGARTSLEVDGSDMFKSTFHLGFGYGRLRNNRVLFSIGFLYTKVAYQDSILVRFPNAMGTYPTRNIYSHINLFDVDFNLDFFFNSLRHRPWSPFIGLNFKGGLMVFSTDLRDPMTGLKYATESQVKTTLGVNFGADVKIWRAPSGRSFMTLSSRNSWDILASGNRPRYLNIGVGWRYFFRP